MKSRLFDGQISNGLVLKWSGFSCGFSANLSITRLFKIRKFFPGFQIVFDKIEAIYLDFKWLGFRIFRSHLKSRPFATQPLFDHLKSRQVWISDPHYIWSIMIFETFCCPEKHGLYHINFDWPWWLSSLRHPYFKFKLRSCLRSLVRIPLRA